MSQVIGPTVHALPSQLVLFEMGGAAGVPAPGAQVRTDWFDTYRLAPEDVIVRQTAGTVDTTDGFPHDTVGVRMAGVYFLDLAVQYAHIAFPLQIIVSGLIPPALQTISSQTIAILWCNGQAFTQDGGIPINPKPRHFRVPLTARYVGLLFFFHPFAQATVFNAAAVLRST